VILPRAEKAFGVKTFGKMTFRSNELLLKINFGKKAFL
jgi:hypothetical protein